MKNLNNPTKKAPKNLAHRWRSQFEKKKNKKNGA